MFSKEVDADPKWLVKHNKIRFGSYKSVPQKFDISGMRGPFTGLPLPPFVTDNRIKSTLSYIFNLEKEIGVVEYFDGKIFGTAEVVIWDKETGQKYSYHTLMLPRRHFVPVDTIESVCASYRNSRFIKLFWSKKINRFSLNLKLRGDKYRPSVKCVVHADYMQKQDCEFLSVSPAPTSTKCSASWIVPLAVTGGMAFVDKKDLEKTWAEEAPGLSMLKMNRVYATLRTFSESLYCITEVDGKKVGFHFSNNSFDPVDNDKYNDNVLFVDKEMTLMPSVFISHTFGLSNNWVIQDTESMVDLVFVPKSRENHCAKIFVLRNQYTMIYGTLEGVILTKSGEKIELKNCPAIVKKNLLRS